MKKADILNRILKPHFAIIEKRIPTSYYPNIYLTMAVKNCSDSQSKIFDMEQGGFEVNLSIID